MLLLSLSRIFPSSPAESLPTNYWLFILVLSLPTSAKSHICPLCDICEITHMSFTSGLFLLAVIFKGLFSAVACIICNAELYSIHTHKTSCFPNHPVMDLWVFFLPLGIRNSEHMIYCVLCPWFWFFLLLTQRQSCWDKWFHVKPSKSKQLPDYISTPHRWAFTEWCFGTRHYTQPQGESKVDLYFTDG